MLYIYIHTHTHTHAKNNSYIECSYTWHEVIFYTYISSKVIRYGFKKSSFHLSCLLCLMHGNTSYSVNMLVTVIRQFMILYRLSGRTCYSGWVIFELQSLFSSIIKLKIKYTHNCMAYISTLKPFETHVWSIVVSALTCLDLQYHVKNSSIRNWEYVKKMLWYLTRAFL